MQALEALRKGKHLAAHDGRSAGRSRQASIARTVAGCRAMFNWAMKADLVGANPFDRLSPSPL